MDLDRLIKAIAITGCMALGFIALLYAPEALFVAMSFAGATYLIYCLLEE